MGLLVASKQAGTQECCHRMRFTLQHETAMQILARVKHKIMPGFILSHNTTASAALSGQDPSRKPAPCWKAAGLAEIKTFLKAEEQAGRFQPEFAY